MPDPVWRTDTVKQIARGVYDTRDYSGLPILADALEEDGYDDPDVLEQLRGNPDAVAGDRLLALLASEETAAAVRWLDDFAREVDAAHGGAYDTPLAPEAVLDYRALMGAGKAYLDSDGEDEFCLPDTQYAYGEQTEFWKNYKLVTGAAPDDPDAGLFRCSC